MVKIYFSYQIIFRPQNYSDHDLDPDHDPDLDPDHDHDLDPDLDLDHDLYFPLIPIFMALEFHRLSKRFNR